MLMLFEELTNLGSKYIRPTWLQSVFHEPQVTIQIVCYLNLAKITLTRNTQFCQLLATKDIMIVTVCSSILSDKTSNFFIISTHQNFFVTFGSYATSAGY